MKSSEPFSWRKRALSFRYALKGMGRLFADEHNSRIHIFFALLAVALGLWLGIERWEWVAVVMCIGAVLAAEAFNSAVEALADRFGAERHPLLGKAKDVAAAGVLFLALASVVVGVIVFWGKLTVRLGLG